jgi:hypothetical protein
MNRMLNAAKEGKGNGPGVKPNRNGYLNPFKPIQKAEAIIYYQVINMK